jgi:hypothetical protein
MRDLAVGGTGEGFWDAEVRVLHSRHNAVSPTSDLGMKL